MDQQIGQMVPERIQPPHRIIQREGVCPERTARMKLGDRLKIKKIINGRVVFNVGMVVKNKYAVQGIGIRQRSREADQENRKYRKSLHHINCAESSSSTSRPAAEALSIVPSCTSRPSLMNPWTFS